MILILLLAWASLVQEPRDAPVFRAGVSMVRVDAQVVVQDRQVDGLTVRDFVVYDAGRPQTVEYFARESEPVDLMLLLDVSGSMRRHVEQVAQVALGALGQLKPNDRVALMLFSREAELREEFTGDFPRVAARLKGAVREKGIRSWTAINSSVISAAAFMKQQPVRGRRAILILTDNQGLHYQVPDERAIQALLEADCVLNAIVTGKGGRPEPPKTGPDLNPDFTPPDVFRLAAETGGETVSAEHAGDAFRQMIERIRVRYTLHYRAPDDIPGAFRPIRVELAPEARARHPRARVLARSGYYWQP